MWQLPPVLQVDGEHTFHRIAPQDHCNQCKGRVVIYDSWHSPRDPVVVMCLRLLYGTAPTKPVDWYRVDSEPR